jgi:hypothetical protein
MSISERCSPLISRLYDRPCMRAAALMRAIHSARNCALALAPIAIGVLPGLDDRLLGDPVDLAARAVVALRFAQDFLCRAGR